MVTTGDIEFEQPTSKMISLTRSIIAMPSDEDSTLHLEILEDLTRRVHARATAEPENWWLVKDVAELYLECRNLAKLRRAEREFLFPLGLNRTTFIERQTGMDSALVDQIARDMIGYRLPGLSLILAGIDPHGPHIYVIHDNDLGCYDGVGYAAIGAGARHANAQLSLAGQTWHSPVHETLLWTYIAKKRAEIAPGVGAATDLYMLGPGLGQSDTLRPDHVAKLDREYRRLKKFEDKGRRVAVKEMDDYVKNITPHPQAQSQPQASPEPEGPKESPERTSG